MHILNPKNAINKDPRKRISENCFKPINFVKKANYYLRKKKQKEKKISVTCS